VKIFPTNKDSIETLKEVEDFIIINPKAIEIDVIIPIEESAGIFVLVLI
jgi:hypothetical protein